ncbi:MAG: asparagine synthase (glutamine-hydrolyzing), partial [Acidobacteria bacterium]|nr:asparagine synthase (glutamine-hydrolyzing) [Acidobacteriota bacterium]
RLRIIDLEGGRQPMADAAGTLHLVFNGEIYNYRGLRRLLQARGVSLRTQSDTETILGLYEVFGLRCVEFLHGMFAFVIWDAERRRLVAARDRLGIKPLYVLRQGETLALASEVKAFLPLAEWTPRVAGDRLAEYLIYRGLAGNGTMFQGVERLAPGELLVATAERVRRERYWQLPHPVVPGAAGAAAPTPRSEQQWAEELDALLDEVVREHLASDVPLGTFNSGGLDSSLVTALAARAQGQPLNTYSVGFADPAFDETAFAGMVAERFGTRHHRLEVSGSEYAEWLPRAIWHNDEPLSHPHSVQLLLLSRLAKQRVTVVLTGEGSDELFGGYRRYRLPALLDRLPVPSRWLRPGLALAWPLLGDLERLRARALFGDVPRTAGKDRGGASRVRVEGLAAFVAERQARRLLGAGPRDALARRAGADVLAHRPGVLARTLWFDQQTYLQALLHRLDRMTMAASVEGRVPFLDHRVVELAAQLPPGLKVHDMETKYLLKRVGARYLPAAITKRRKAGFSVPVAAWLRPGGALADTVALLLEPASASRGYCSASELGKLVEDHRRGRRNHAEALWALINLELWHRLWGEQARRFKPESPLPLAVDAPGAATAAAATAAAVATPVTATPAAATAAAAEAMTMPAAAPAAAAFNLGATAAAAEAVAGSAQ